MDVLGLVAGLLANMLIPSGKSQGLILTCVTGVAGALPAFHLLTSLGHAGRTQRLGWAHR